MNRMDWSRFRQAVGDESETVVKINLIIYISMEIKYSLCQEKYLKVARFINPKMIQISMSDFNIAH